MKFLIFMFGIYSLTQHDIETVFANTSGKCDFVSLYFPPIAQDLCCSYVLAAKIPLGCTHLHSSSKFSAFSHFWFLIYTFCVGACFNSVVIKETNLLNLSSMLLCSNNSFQGRDVEIFRNSNLL